MPVGTWRSSGLPKAVQHVRATPAALISCLGRVQSDKVLQSTIASMKELEGRCNTAAEQGDLLAGSMDELERRITVIQHAIMQQAPAGVQAGLASTLRGGRREPRGASPDRTRSAA